MRRQWPRRRMPRQPEFWLFAVKLTGNAISGKRPQTSRRLPTQVVNDNGHYVTVSSAVLLGTSVYPPGSVQADGDRLLCASHSINCFMLPPFLSVQWSHTRLIFPQPQETEVASSYNHAEPRIIFTNCLRHLALVIPIGRSVSRARSVDLSRVRRTHHFSPDEFSCWPACVAIR